MYISFSIRNIGGKICSSKGKFKSYKKCVFKAIFWLRKIYTKILHYSEIRGLYLMKFFSVKRFKFIPFMWVFFIFQFAQVCIICNSGNVRNSKKMRIDGFSYSKKQNKFSKFNRHFHQT